MWWRKNPKNRRVGREYVLDVKMRSSKVRAARVRMVAVGLGTVFVTILTIYLLWRAGEFALDKLIYQNPAFAVQEIDLQTDGVMAVEQLRQWAGVKTGENLLALDLARVKRDLEMHSMVQSVSIERALPRTLRIRVAEREPIAQINVLRPREHGGIEASVLQMDGEGYVTVPLEPRQRSANAQAAEPLPVLLGINPSDLQPGRRLDNPQVLAALRLIQDFSSSPIATLVEVKTIDVSGYQVLTVTTSQGSEITLGLNDLDRQLRRWLEIFDFGQRMGKSLASLDLAITNHIPARWLDAAVVTPAPPKPLKPLRVKKKHV
jgi:cell division septal protein FtsQ